MATQEECTKAVEDLAKALHVSSEKSETVTKHILGISKEDAETYGQIITAVKTTYGAMKKFQSDEPTEVISGILDTIGAFSALAGPAGMVLSGICGLISGFISDSSGDGGNNFEKLIDEALEKSRCSELEEKGAGVGKKFKVWQIYMSNGNPKLTEKEVDDLLEHYNLDTGVGFLGELMKHIKQQKTTQDAEPAKRILHLINLYCQLSIIREMLLHQIITLMANSEGRDQRESTIKSYRAVLKDLTSHKEEFKFLHRPSIEEIVMASVYIPGKWPDIAKYLKHVGLLDVARPYPSKQELRVEKWPNHYLISKLFDGKGTNESLACKYYYLTTSQKKKDGPKFSFIQEKNGLLIIYDALRLEGNCLSKSRDTEYWGLNGKEGRAGTSSFKLILTDNEKCLLSCSDKPDKFMYITSFLGSLKRWKGDPGEAGYWKITTTTGEI